MKFKTALLTTAASALAYTTHSAYAALYVSQITSTTTMYNINESTAAVTTMSLTSGQLTQPLGVAISNGKLYMSNSTTVKRIDGFGNVTSFASGFFNAYGIAFDSVGNLYVANQSSTIISKVTPGGVVSTFASGINNPQGLAFDSAGNLYASSSSAGNIKKITPLGVVSVFANLTGNSQGMAFDPSGNLYVANGNSVFKIVSSSPGVFLSSSTIGAVSAGRGVVTDSSGNIFVVSQGGSITKFLPGGVTPTTFVSGLSSSPYFITQGTVRSLGGFWIGADSTIGGAGTWTGTGGTSWAFSNANGPGGEWDTTKVATFNGTSTTGNNVTVSGTVNTTAGLQFNQDGYALAGGVINLGGTGGLANGITVNTSLTTSIDSTLVGSNGMSKFGLGKLILTGSSSYSGGTTIFSGTLLANNSTGSATGSGDITVASGATFGGTGAVTGNVTVNAGASLVPGASIGTLSTGAISLAASTSNFKPEIDVSSTPDADLINVTGTVSLGGSTLALSLLNTASMTVNSLTFLLINNDGADAVTGSFGSITGVPPTGGFAATVNYKFTGTDSLGRVGDGNDVAVTITVPEPATLGLSVVSLGMLLGGRNKTKRKSK